MRRQATIVHVDLDAFFASVEQRDKPSLRGRPVIVGGTGVRGVVSTASYEARTYGARSAMSTAEARAICPAGTAFLSTRFEAYQASSRVVMGILRRLSPAVEQVSIDEAYLDLEASKLPDFSVETIQATLEQLQHDIADATGGLGASAGAASSKMMAKLASERNKPAGVCVIAPGQELAILGPMPVRAISGVGPATASRLRTFGVESVDDLRRMSQVDLVSVFGEKHGASLYDLARAQDRRTLTLEREAKSVSAEETFETDVRSKPILQREVDAISERIATKIQKQGVFARTVVLKLRRPDFSIVTRSLTASVATGDAVTIAGAAKHLLDGVDVSEGVRLIGVGVSGFVPHSQGELFAQESLLTSAAGTEPETSFDGFSSRFTPSADKRWNTGADVSHPVHGTGWVWGSGRGRVTVRFEGPHTKPGPVKTFHADDPLLTAATPPWQPSAEHLPSDPDSSDEPTEHPADTPRPIRHQKLS